MVDILNYAAMRKFNDALVCNVNLKANYTPGSSSSCSVSVNSNMLISGATGLSGVVPSSPYYNVGSSGYSAAVIGLTSCWNALCSCLLVCNVPTACGLKVCDTSGYFRCDVCCLWTVPSGVTRAQFQIWGAGAGSSWSCCCGGSFFGATGAFAVASIPVVAGCTYTLCSGCSYCCLPGTGGSYGTPGYGAASYVIGTNLTGFCAQGGCSCMILYNSSQCNSASSSCCVWWQNVGQGFSTGLCMCDAGWDFCYNSGGSGCSDISFSCSTKPYGSVTGANSFIYGIPGMYPSWCISSGWTGKTTAAPVFGFISTSQCSLNFNQNCGGAGLGFFGSGYLAIPGAGGYAYSATAGGTGCCGDPGRMGMVCVTYC